MVRETPQPAPLDPGDVEQYLALEKLREHTGSRDLMEPIFGLTARPMPRRCCCWIASTPGCESFSRG
jgi:hypothetical protein